MVSTSGLMNGNHCVTGRVKTTGYDLHATILHLLGIDHTRLTFRTNGSDRPLSGVDGHVIKKVLV